MIYTPSMPCWRASEYLVINTQLPCPLTQMLRMAANGSYPELRQSRRAGWQGLLRPSLLRMNRFA
jgi:hypothetical protein